MSVKDPRYNQMQPAVVSRRQLLKIGTSLVATAALAGCAAGGTDSNDAPRAVQKMSLAPTAEHVRLIGRTYEEDGVTWLPQSGSAVEFSFTGTHLAVELVGDESVSNDPDLLPRFAVLVDGEVVLDDTLSEPVRTIEVPTGSGLAGAVIQLIHLSEASRGTVGIRSITVESDANAPVTPTAEPDLSIGFVGDSITCAYGVEAADTDEPFKTTTENFLKSYAYLVAQELDADYDTVCYSGYGIVSGWSGDGQRNERILMPPLYDLVVEGHAQAWDFAAHPRDVVVINLGTNDFTYTGTDEARMQEFSEGYAAFVEQVRARNPESLIVCTLGTMWDCGALYPTLEQAVDDYAVRAGDSRVACYQAAPLDLEADGCGTSGHPNETTQRKIAAELTEVIRRELTARG